MVVLEWFRAAAPKLCELLRAPLYMTIGAITDISSQERRLGWKRTINSVLAGAVDVLFPRCIRFIPTKLDGRNMRSPR
jgi:hypothetical protein